VARRTTSIIADERDRRFGDFPQKRSEIPLSLATNFLGFELRWLSPLPMPSLAERISV
jgi:hypothetical protein